jgi:beta-glucosidase
MIRHLRTIAVLALSALLPQTFPSPLYGQADQKAQSAAIADDPKADRFVAELMAKMTLAEKLGQMTQIALNGPPDSLSPEEHARRGEVGSFLFVKDAARINQLQHIAVDESRLHIPIIFGFDVIHGFRTIYPVPLALAASWAPAEAERAQMMAAREASAVGINWTFAPMLDIARDPRWGRSLSRLAHGRGAGSRLSRSADRYSGTRACLHQTLCRVWSCCGRT